MTPFEEIGITIITAFVGGLIYAGYRILAGFGVALGGRDQEEL